MLQAHYIRFETILVEEDLLSPSMQTLVSCRDSFATTREHFNEAEHAFFFVVLTSRYNVCCWVTAAPGICTRPLLDCGSGLFGGGGDDVEC